ncbi:MAG: hypothetical protein ABIH23_32440 [bacterium]
MRLSLVLCFILILGANPIGAEPWLRVSVDEISSASPIKALATMPVRLATAVFQAVPPQYHEDALEEGFDLSAISRTLESLPEGEQTTIVHEDISVRAAKFSKEDAEARRPSFLVVKLNGTEISCPLLITGTAINILTLMFEELKPVKEELRAVLDEAKTVPPDRLLWCTDQENTLEISLK